MRGRCFIDFDATLRVWENLRVQSSQTGVLFRSHEFCAKINTERDYGAWIHRLNFYERRMVHGIPR